MKQFISAEHLAAYRKTFGSMTTEELRAVVEGRKPHNLSEESLGALRLLLAERKGGERVSTIQRTEAPKIDLPPWRDSPGVNPPKVHPAISPRWVICAIIVVATLLALPATRDELRWLRVSDGESVADEQGYLAAWPDGRHADEARARIQQHAWSVTVGLDSIEGFQSYLAAFPQGEHAAEAQAKIEALKWEVALTANDIKQLKGILREYPNSQHATEARARIEALKWEAALLANGIRDFEGFLREYPNSQHAADARSQIRSQLTDIFVLEGAGGDGSGRDWQNACGSLKLVIEGNLTPGAKIHIAAGLIQESVDIPDNIHLVCGYGRNPGGIMELNPRSHRVFLMPAAEGSRSMTIGRGCQLSGLWLGQTTLSALNALRIKTPDHVYLFCASISGPAKLELSGLGMRMEFDGAFQMEEYEPRSQQFASTIRGTGSARIERAGEQFNINSQGTGASIHIER